MTSALRPRTLVLFVGDILFFTGALWLSLYARAFEVPTPKLFLAHLAPFSFLFVAWVAVFFISGLYESRSLMLARRALSSTLLTAQTINILIAVLFFFFVPSFGIAPKTLLVIYAAVSFLLVLFWRAAFFPLLGLQKPERAVVVGEGEEVEELLRTLEHAPHAPVRVVEVLRLEDALSAHAAAALKNHAPRFIIADFSDPRVSGAFPGLYNLIFRGVRFIDVSTLYEEIFGRVPLSHIDDRWLVLNVSRYAHLWYDPFKRCIDIVLALPAGVISLLFYPFIALAIALDSKGAVLLKLPRVGEGGKIFPMYKFRSMTGDDQGCYGTSGASTLTVTRVGSFLRKMRLDELPQLWNVLRGDLSLIGPRPEIPELVATYEREIPYYGARHLVRPGLSGSAQLYYHGDPHHAADVEATRQKLSYDLFYLKHRSLSLDLSIILKTVRRLLVKSNA